MKNFRLIICKEIIFNKDYITIKYRPYNSYIKSLIDFSLIINQFIGKKYFIHIRNKDDEDSILELYVENDINLNNYRVDRFYHCLHPNIIKKGIINKNIIPRIEKYIIKSMLI